jgi:hypothetical protein
MAPAPEQPVAPRPRLRWATTAGTPAALTTGFVLVGAGPFTVLFLSALGALAVGGFRAIVNGSAF